MFSPQVTLRSGGYIVINQTEALVSIDVNSGRSTREHNIEDTALQTNLEAAEEVARQLRLRDLAGLIVIDFIDMEEKRNNRAVERKLKDALKNDRARIQVGRISHFGLLEMSRQRIRTGVLESTTTACPTCQGTGHVRAPASVALHVLRSLEDQLLARRHAQSHHPHAHRGRPLHPQPEARAPLRARASLRRLDHRCSPTRPSPTAPTSPLERGEAVERREPLPVSVQPDSVHPIVEDEDEDVVEEEDNVEEVGENEVEEIATDDRSDEAGSGEERDERGGRKRRRRRRRRGGEGAPNGQPADARNATEGATDDTGDDHEDDGDGEERADSAEQPNGSDQPRPEGDGQRKRRRGRRGGRRGRGGRGGEDRGPGEGREPRNDRAPLAADAPIAPDMAMAPGDAVEPGHSANGYPGATYSDEPVTSDEPMTAAPAVAEPERQPPRPERERTPVHSEPAAASEAPRFEESAASPPEPARHKERSDRQRVRAFARARERRDRRRGGRSEPAEAQRLVAAAELFLNAAVVVERR